jgi:hypothetical protein
MSKSTPSTLSGHREFWLVTGSQHLYGEDVLRQVAEQSQQVLEELTDRDLLAIIAVARHEAGQPMVDRVVQRQRFLSDELQHDDGDERLGVAAHPEVAVEVHRLLAVELRHAAVGEAPAAAVVDLRQHAGDPARVKLVGAILKYRG